MEGPDYEGIATPAGQQRSQQPAAAAAAAAGRQGLGAGSVPPRSNSQPGASSAAAAGAAGQEGRRPSSSAAGPPSYGQLFGEAAQPSARPSSPAKAPAAAKAQPVEDDLLGMGSGSSSSQAPPAASAAAAPAAAAAAAVDDDLLGFGGGAAPAASSSTAHIEDLFTVPSAKPRPAAAAAARPAPAAPAPRPSGSRGAGLDSMIDLGADLPAVDTSGFEDMYEVRRVWVYICLGDVLWVALAADTLAAGVVGASVPLGAGVRQPFRTHRSERRTAEHNPFSINQSCTQAELAAGGGDEPEERRALRLRRIQEKHARMQQQVGARAERGQLAADGWSAVQRWYADPGAVEHSGG